MITEQSLRQAVEDCPWMTQEDLGRRFGCSVTTIKMRIMDWGIPYKYKRIKGGKAEEKPGKTRERVFEDNIKERYRGATVWNLSNPERLLMDDGKVLDKKWWADKKEKGLIWKGQQNEST